MQKHLWRLTKIRAKLKETIIMKRSENSFLTCKIRENIKKEPRKIVKTKDIPQSFKPDTVS